MFKKLTAVAMALAMATPTLSLNVIAEEPEAETPVVETTGEEAAAEAWELTVLYSNDVHTYIDKTLSYATISQMKKDLAAEGKNVLLVDAGDHVQGTAYGAMDNGATIIELMNAADYDLATFGNHEFDYGMARALEIVGEADFPYVTCNFTKVDGSDVLETVKPYQVFEIDGVKVAFVGITTPETYTKSTPAYFMNEAQTEFIYTIAGGADGSALYTAVQNAVTAAKAEADIVIGLGHCGDDPSSEPWTSEDVIANVSGLDAWIDGHSHSTVPMKEVSDKDGNKVILTQTGNYFSAIGEMTITEDGITTKLVTSYEGSDPAVAEIQTKWMNDVDSQLNTKIAESDIEFTINGADGKRAVRSAETNLGDLNADAYYWYFNMKEGLNCDIAIMNGGGVRASVPAGDWSYKTTKTVNTFGNVLCLMEVTGQQILDAIEWGAKSVGEGENGGFLQVAGATYNINTDIPSTVQKDENNIWTGGPTAAYRVEDLCIYNKETGEYEPIDVTKTYTMAGTNYTLRSMGDGFNMFGGATLVKDYVSEDYMADAAYVSAFADTDGNGYGNIASANSPLAAYEGYKLNYEDPKGAARIANVELPAIEATQRLVIVGDDWGPAVQKTILTLSEEVKAEDLDPACFTVVETKESTNWADLSVYNASAPRKVVDVYLSDEKGNKVEDAEGQIVTVEMYISPNDGSPFRYDVPSGSNKWCEPYELAVVGYVGESTKVVSDQAIDLKDDANWECDAAKKFDVTKSYTAKDGYTYAYGEYKPAEDGKKNALVIWLHGAGEGMATGTFDNDNYVDLLGNEVTALAGDEFQEIMGGAYVITPQAPTMWMAQPDTMDYPTADETEIRSVYADGLFELIDNYVKNNPDVDPENIIIGGCSNGGYMTMNMIIDHPDYFAKAFPICEAYYDNAITDAEIKALAESGIGIWFTHAMADTTVNPEETTLPTYDRLVKAGAEVHFTKWEVVEDLTGRFVNADGTPYTYAGHWSWIYFDNNANVTCVGGGEENCWQWLAGAPNKHETATEDKPEDKPTQKPQTGVDTGDSFNAGIFGGLMAACAGLAAAAWFALKNRK